MNHQSRRKCAHCGLVNSSADESCRRCGMALPDDESSEPIPANADLSPTTKKRGFSQAGQPVVLGATSILLVDLVCVALD